MNRNDKLVRNIGFGVFIVVMVTAVLLGSSAVGEDDDGTSYDTSIFQEVQLNTDTTAKSGELTEGESESITVQAEGMLIRNITAAVTWSDESSVPGRPRVRRYENQPDTFMVTLKGPDGNLTSTEANANNIGEAGLVETSITLTEEQLLNFIDPSMDDQGNVSFEWNVDVTLSDVGIWQPVFGPGVIGLTDSGNQYSLKIEYDYYLIEDLVGE